MSKRAHRITREAKWAAIGIALMLVAGYAAVLIMGLIVVHDPDDRIVQARIVASGGASQPLHELPGHLFVAIPRLEGEIAVRCRDGSASRGGYVTPHISEQATVKGRCQLTAG